MDLAPMTALLAAIETIAAAGLDPAIEAVAGVASARNRFLTRSWFGAAIGRRRARTLIARRQDGRPVIALPISRGRWWRPAVPGCYWPCRSFPVAADLQDEELAGFLRSAVARHALGRLW